MGRERGGMGKLGRCRGARREKRLNSMYGSLRGTRWNHFSSTTFYNIWWGKKCGYFGRLWKKKSGKVGGDDRAGSSLWESSNGFNVKVKRGEEKHTDIFKE